MARVAASGDQAVAQRRDVDVDVDVLVRAAPVAAWTTPTDAPTIAPAVRQSTLPGAPADIAAAGWWGGLGTLLADVALQEASDPLQVHVAYGCLGNRRVYANASPTLRQELVRLATDEATARVRGQEVAEPLGEGRRLAWFPAPVGPAHAVAVGGLEHLAPLVVPTVRTWLAAGSMGAELLQAVGRLDPHRGIGAWLDRRAVAGAGTGDTGEVRWAVVVEVLDGQGEIVRAWANGTDPVAAAADLLVLGARRLANGTRPLPSGTVLDLGPSVQLLDGLADLRTLRWSVSRPQASRR